MIQLLRFCFVSILAFCTSCTNQATHEPLHNDQLVSDFIGSLVDLRRLHAADLSAFYELRQSFQNHLQKQTSHSEAGQKGTNGSSAGYKQFQDSAWFELEWLSDSREDLEKLQAAYVALKQADLSIRAALPELVNVLDESNYSALAYVERKLVANLDQVMLSLGFLFEGKEVERYSKTLYESGARIRYIVEALRGLRSIPEIPQASLSNASKISLEKFAKQAKAYEGEITQIWYRVGYIQALNSNINKLVASLQKLN